MSPLSAAPHQAGRALLLRKPWASHAARFSTEKFSSSALSAIHAGRRSPRFLASGLARAKQASTPRKKLRRPRRCEASSALRIDRRLAEVGKASPQPLPGHTGLWQIFRDSHSA